MCAPFYLEYEWWIYLSGRNTRISNTQTHIHCILAMCDESSTKCTKKNYKGTEKKEIEKYTHAHISFNTSSHTKHRKD